MKVSLALDLLSYNTSGIFFFFLLFFWWGVARKIPLITIFTLVIPFRTLMFFHLLFPLFCYKLVERLDSKNLAEVNLQRQ